MRSPDNSLLVLCGGVVVVVAVQNAGVAGDVAAVDDVVVVVGVAVAVVFWVQ